jgi:hypothetical protein
LHSGLERIREGISRSSDVTDATKVQAIADIETVKMQLAKEEPDKHILSRIWPAIERVALSAGLTADIATVGALIAGAV